MNSESSTNVLTRQWRIATGRKTVNARNRMPETGASGSVGGAFGRAVVPGQSAERKNGFTYLPSLMATCLARGKRPTTSAFKTESIRRSQLFSMVG